MSKILKWGSVGASVADLQTQLMHLFPHSYPGSGKKVLKIDGIFGPNTERWVRKFQNHAKIKVDGKVGPQTWAEIEKHRIAQSGSQSPDTPRTTASPPKPKRGKILYVHDEKAPDAGETFGRHKAREKQGDVRSITIPRKTKLDDVMKRIERAIGNDPLELLILNAHGTTAQVSIGEKFGPNDLDHFKKLRPIFQRNPGFKMGIEIHSCCFAAPKDVGYRKQDWTTRLRGGVVDTLQSLVHSASQGKYGNKKPWRDEFPELGWDKVETAVGLGTKAMLTIAKNAQCTVKAGFFAQYSDPYGKFESNWACVWPPDKIRVYYKSISPDAVM